MLQTSTASSKDVVMAQPSQEWTAGPPRAAGFYWVWKPIFPGSDLRNLSFVHQTQDGIHDPSDDWEGWFHAPAELPAPPFGEAAVEPS